MLQKKNIVKKNKSEDEIRAAFLAHDCSHFHQEKIFTDGSKSPDGVGCAVVYGNSIFQAKLPDNTSVFIAELTAIIQALML